MRARRKIGLALFGLAIILLLLPYLAWHPRRLNHKGFEQIQNGMTQQEVESLLGGPPGIYYPSYCGAGWIMTAEKMVWPNATEVAWYDDRNRYEVWFDAEGLVAGKHRRSGWQTASFTSRHAALLHGAKKPMPHKGYP